MSARLALPLRMSNGRLATVEHDSLAATAQAVALLLDTRPGERRSVPAYGMPDQLFTGLDAEQVRAAVQQWHPQTDPVAIELALSGTTQTVTVTPGSGDEAFA